MSFVVDAVNEAASWAALDEPCTSHRFALRIIMPDGTERLIVRDGVAQTVGGKFYHAMPFMAFSEFNSGQGNAADVLTITVSGASMIDAGLSDPMASDIIGQLVTAELRDRPVQLSYIVLDVNTAQPIGLIPIFVGFVDSGKMMLVDEGREFELRVGSYRAFAAKRPRYVYSDDDHRLLFPNDGFFKHHSDVVNKERVIAWNTTTGGTTTTGGATTTGGGRGGLFNDR